MTREDIIQKVINELMINNVCLIFNPHIFGTYMEQIYSAGNDNGRKTTHNQKKVVQCDLDGTELETYESLTRASSITGISLKTISKVISKNDIWHKTAGGYKWKYKIQ